MRRRPLGLRGAASAAPAAQARRDRAARLRPGAGARLVVDEDAGTREGSLDPLAAAAAEEAIPAALASGRSRCIELEDGGLLFVESVAPAPRVVIVGAVDTTEALCRYAHVLGWRTVVLDPRAAFATRERIPSADELHVGWPDDVYPAIGLEPADAVVVLTHDPKIDDPAIALALEAGAGYVGALGSRRTQASRRERLVEERGIAREDAERVHGPVGLDLGGETPQETALAIAAEIVAWRSGRTGVPLATTSGRIHRTDEPEPALA
ncbi:MAG: XdhC family protein [Thermoleophilia bacterium]